MDLWMQAKVREREFSQLLAVRRLCPCRTAPLLLQYAACDAKWLLSNTI